MIGFGPTIWSRRRGETEYGVKAIPLGGYIRMIGMFPPKPGADPTQLRASSTGRFSQLMDQARQDSLEEVGPGDEHRVFYKLSVPKKLVIMLGGPTMNLLIAVVLVTGVTTLYGANQLTPRISSVSQCVTVQTARHRGASGLHRQGPGGAGQQGRAAPGGPDPVHRRPAGQHLGRGQGARPPQRRTRRWPWSSIATAPGST